MGVSVNNRAKDIDTDVIYRKLIKKLKSYNHEYESHSMFYPLTIHDEISMVL